MTAIHQEGLVLSRLNEQIHTPQIILVEILMVNKNRTANTKTINTVKCKRCGILIYFAHVDPGKME